MKIAPAQIQAFAAKPSATRVLLYGPDQGRVALLAETLVRRFAQEAVVIDGEKIGQNADTLASALAAPQTLFGGTRAVRIRNAGDRVTKILKELLAERASTAALVVEAGELAASSSLRKLFEGARDMAAIACYLLEERDRAQLARQTLEAKKIRIDGDALAYLASCLPPDTLAAKAELDKLATFLGTKTACTLADAQALVGDAAEFDLDEAALAAADGDAAGLMRAIARLGADATAIGLLRSAQRHFLRLAGARAAIDAGASLESTVNGLRPPLFFKVKSRFTAQLRAWTLPRLERALGKLTEAEILVKRTGYPDDTLAAHVLFELAVDARTEAQS